MLLEGTYKVGVCPPFLWGIGDIAVLWGTLPDLNWAERSDPDGGQVVLVLIEPLDALLKSFLWCRGWNMNGILNLIIDVADRTDELSPAGFNTS